MVKRYNLIGNFMDHKQDETTDFATFIYCIKNNSFPYFVQSNPPLRIYFKMILDLSFPLESGPCMS